LLENKNKLAIQIGSGEREQVRTKRKEEGYVLKFLPEITILFSEIMCLLL
jgi:hypothetical protein